MRRTPFVTAALLAVCVSSAGVQPVNPSARRFEGVVDIPKAFGSRDEILRSDDVRPIKAFRLELRDTPTLRSRIVAIVTTVDLIETREIGHPFVAASVFARAAGWNLLRLTNGQYGWLPPTDAGEFTSFEDLLRDQADWSIAGGWNRTIADRPGGATRLVPRDPRRFIVGYLEGLGPRQRVPDTPDGQKTIKERHGGNSALVVTRDGTRLLEFAAGVVVPVFDRPEEGARQIGQVENHAAGLTLLTAAEGENPPVVFSQRPGWFEVGLLSQNEPAPSHRQLMHAWIQDRADAWRFHGVARDEADRILSTYWGVEDGPAIDVQDTRNVGGRLWLRVRLFYDTECVRLLEDLEQQQRPTIAEGWIPAHDDDGQPLVWFETYCD